MKILWINPVGTDLYDLPIAEMLKGEAGNGTRVDIVSLPRDRPLHLEYHSYEGIVTADITRIVYGLKDDYDAFVIGCYYDVALREAREVSGRALVLAPFKLAESLGESALRFGWTPSRKWGSEAPPGREVEEWGIFKGDLPIGNFLKG